MTLTILTYKCLRIISLLMFALINKILIEYCEMKSTNKKTNINLWDKDKILKNTL